MNNTSKTNIDERPNIVFLFPDQWRADCLGHTGHPDINTAWVDQLAAEGCSYSRAFSPAPTCIPARMALMTGMSPWLNGRTGYEECVTWNPPHTLPGILRDNGYQTMQIGKTHFHPMRAHLGFEINDSYEASIRESGFISDYHRALREAHPLVEDAALRRHPNAWCVNPWQAEREWHCSEWISRRAIERIQQRDPLRPFFMQIAYHRPHPPFDPPFDLWEKWRQKHIKEPYIGDWATDTTYTSHGIEGGHAKLRPQDLIDARRGYYASIEHVDEQIGRIYWALRQHNLLENTYIVFSSDHGEFLGDHHRWHKGQPNAACARIPLIVRPPNSYKDSRGVISNRPTLLQGITAFCFQWAHVDIPIQCDARALDQTISDWIHAEHHSDVHGWHALYNETWAYHWFSDGTERLFNHSIDPQELHNCVSTEHQTLQDARQHLIQLLYTRGCGTSDGKSLSLHHHIGATQTKT